MQGGGVVAIAATSADAIPPASPCRLLGAGRRPVDRCLWQHAWRGSAAANRLRLAHESLTPLFSGGSLKPDKTRQNQTLFRRFTRPLNKLSNAFIAACFLPLGPSCIPHANGIHLHRFCMVCIFCRKKDRYKNSRFGIWNLRCRFAMQKLHCFDKH